MIIFDLSFLFELRSIVLSFFNLISQSDMSLLLPTFLLHSDKISSWVLIKSSYLLKLFGQNYFSQNLKLHIQYNTHIWDLAWVTLCSYFNVSGGSGSFAVGKGQLLFQSGKCSKMGMICIVYGEISHSSGPELPLGSPNLCHLWKSQMWIPLYDTDGDSLMTSTN